MNECERRDPSRNRDEEGNVPMRQSVKKGHSAPQMIASLHSAGLANASTKKPQALAAKA